MSHSYHYKQRHLVLSLVVFVISIALYYAQQAGWIQHVGRGAVTNQPGLYHVTQFVDGDTITVNMNGTNQKIRFIGVDTPETHKPNTPVQCYGPAAAAYTKQRIGNQSIRLQSDSLTTNYDRYGRLLRYVYLPDGTNLNRDLILHGYGFYYPYFPFTKSSEFAATQKTAQSSHAGLWGNCKPTPTDAGGYVSNVQGS
jgi:micrococcal nuclease